MAEARQSHRVGRRSLLPVAIPDEIEQLRERLEQFIEIELRPLELGAGVDANEPPPAELRRQVRRRSQELGFFQLPLSPEEGGPGLGAVGLTALREEIAYSGSVLAGFILGRGGGMLRLAKGEQRERYLLPVVTGDKTYAFAFTEPQAGSGPGGARTSAEPDGESYRLNGTKSFVTDGPYADFLLVLATITETAAGPAGSAMFIVDRESPGLEMGQVLETMDGGVHCVYHFRDVRVPAANILGEIGEGMPRAMQNIGRTRLSLAATAAGTAWRVLDLTLLHTTKPHRSGAPLAQREQVQAMLAEMARDTLQARTLTYAAAAAADRGQPAEVEAALAKMVSTEAAGRVVDQAIQLYGGAAYVQGHP
ncbi:MAG: acyl-CoA dehydrogenase family protein, partial [Dehalococcoidia bacterium]